MRDDRRVKILHLTVGLGLGGAEKLMVEIASGLDRGRFNVQVLCLKSWGPLGDVLRERGIPVTALDGRGPGVFWRLRRFLRENPFDVVHSHVLWANLLAGALKGKSRVLWHVHDTGEWMKTRGLLAPLLPWAERMAFRRADRVIAVSETVARYFSERLRPPPGSVTVLLNGVSVPQDSPPTDAEKAALRPGLFPWPGEYKLVGFVGRLEEPVKGIPYLLRAAREISKSAPEARFALIGDGKDRPALEALNQKEGTDSRVAFLGERADIRPYLRAMDVLVLPSLWEGLPTILLEAMAARLPVVATRVGGVPEVVEEGKTGLLVAPKDARGLAQALLQLLADPEKRASLGRRGRERVKEKFSLETYLRRLGEIYSSLLEEAP